MTDSTLTVIQLQMVSSTLPRRIAAYGMCVASPSSYVSREAKGDKLRDRIDKLQHAHVARLDRHMRNGIVIVPDVEVAVHVCDCVTDEDTVVRRVIR